jgi:proteic killer suppression protein
LTTTPDRGSIIGVIKAVLLSSRARKDLKKAPAQVRDKLAVWILAVSEIGLAEVRKVPGYHDEPLKWARKGERSIRLSLQWRAIYVIATDGSVEFVSVEEVTPHKY